MIHLSRIVAVVLVLLAIALGAYAWMLSRAKPAAPVAAPAAADSRPSAASFPIVVTTKAVPAGQAIGADALRVERLPINPPGAFQDVAAVAGRVPVSDLGEGTPLLEGQLVSGLALHVHEGERAVAVKADEASGVGNRVRPGDFVDVFFVLKSDGKDVEHTQSRLLLPRARVLAFGSISLDQLPSARNADGKTADGKTADGKAANAQNPRPEAARTAVLAVPVTDVNRLALAETVGRLQLALRNPTDTALPDPALFAELPTVLQPRPFGPGTAGRAALQGIDRAQAGLRAADLAGGGSAGAARPMVVRTVASTAPARAAGGATSRGGTEFEIIRGDRRETASY